MLLVGWPLRASLARSRRRRAASCVCPLVYSRDLWAERSMRAGAHWGTVAGPGPARLTSSLPFRSQACTSSHSLCSNLSSTWSLSEFPSPLGGPDAVGEATALGGSEPYISVRHLLT